MLIDSTKYLDVNRRHFTKVRNGQFTFVPEADFDNYLENDGLQNYMYRTPGSSRRIAASTAVYVVCLKCKTRHLYKAKDVKLSHLKCDCASNIIAQSMKRLYNQLLKANVDSELQDILKNRLRNPQPVKVRPLRNFKKMNTALALWLQVDFELYYKRYVPLNPKLEVELRCSVCGAVGTLMQCDVLSKGHTICKHFVLKRALYKYVPLDVSGDYTLQVPMSLAKHCKTVFEKLKPRYSVETKLTLFDFPFVHHAQYAPLFKVDNTFYDVIDWHDWQVAKRSNFTSSIPNSSQTISSLFRLYTYMRKNNIPYKVLLVHVNKKRVAVLSNTESFKNACQEFMLSLNK